MRKAQKERLLDLVRTLQDAHEVIKTYAGDKNIEGTQALLADCQNTAVQMGKLIEQSEGENCATVRLLEDYCDTLFRVYENLDSIAVDKALDHALVQVEHSVEQDIHVRLEVAFFPYKASMWDSLESVWKAADRDPDCDAYVVPIPYYEMRPDRSCGELHYEGKDYPPYVPVVDWQTYDLDKRRPDIAFIHNPYDDQNLMTQVHRTFFSSNLKKYTELLCYIPYFVVNGKVSPHFAYLPAVLNADFTIVESREVRQQYLSVWYDLVKQGRTPEKDLEIVKSRVLALGSPKFDAVTTAEADHPVLPDNWKRLIFRPDGTRKKVIFYNTSISAMLNNTVDEDGNVITQYLDKLEHVLIFFKHREDSVLLWRPHPLLENAFASMRPQLYRRYVQIVQKYRRAEYGIYDNSTDLHRAISVSDAYYGDGSSVAALWEKTGRPLLYADCNVLTTEQRLEMLGLYFDGTSIWGTSRDFNALLRIEPDTLDVHYVGEFPGEEREGSFLFDGIAECSGKLYFAPNQAKHIGVYDKTDGSLFTIPLPQEDGEIREGGYTRAFVWEGDVYMTGGTPPSILKLDTQTREIKKIDIWEKELAWESGLAQHPGYGCQIREKLYLPYGNAGVLLMFDMNSGNSEVYPFAEPGSKYNRCAAVGNQVWIYSSTGGAPLKVINFELDQAFASVRPTPFKSFSSLNACGNTVLGSSFFRDQILSMNTQTGQMQCFPISGSGVCMAVRDQYVYVELYRMGELSVVDWKTGKEIRTKKCTLDGMPKIGICKVHQNYKKYFDGACETSFLNLSTFVANIENIVSERGEIQNCGEHIYWQMRRRLK